MYHSHLYYPYLYCPPLPYEFATKNEIEEIIDDDKKMVQSVLPEKVVVLLTNLLMGEASQQKAPEVVKNLQSEEVHKKKVEKS